VGLNGSGPYGLRHVSLLFAHHDARRKGTVWIGRTDTHVKASRDLGKATRIGWIDPPIERQKRHYPIEDARVQEEGAKLLGQQRADGRLARC
jgi:hypothetical protein